MLCFGIVFIVCYFVVVIWLMFNSTNYSALGMALAIKITKPKLGQMNMNFIRSLSRAAHSLVLNGSR